MKLQDKINKYYDQFKYVWREDKKITVIKDDADTKLLDSIRKAHGDRLPVDWIFKTYCNLLGVLSDYGYLSIEEIEENRFEIIDTLVDVYTSDLTEWLHSSNFNVYYLTEVLEEFEIKDGFKLLAQAQSQAIGEVLSEIISLLEMEV